MYAIFYFLPKALQRIQLNKTEMIESKWQWQKILSFNIGSKYTILNSTESYSLETMLA